VADGLHVQNKTKKPLAMALSVAGRGGGGRDGGGDLTDVGCKSVRIYLNESPLYKEYKKLMNIKKTNVKITGILKKYLDVHVHSNTLAHTEATNCPWRTGWMEKLCGTQTLAYA
jgi:hypothetical protein